MARKKKAEEHVNHERWLVSYADFITLLFAFFVVMFSVSQVDTKKLGKFSEAFVETMGVHVLNGYAGIFDGTNSPFTWTPRSSRRGPPSDYPPSLAELQSQMEKLEKQVATTNADVAALLAAAQGKGAPGEGGPGAQGGPGKGAPGEGGPGAQGGPGKGAPGEGGPGAGAGAVGVKPDEHAAGQPPADFGLRILRRRSELVLRLDIDLLFESGSDVVNPQAYRMLTAIGNALKSRPVAIRVEGHTDNRPIHTTRFRSNWHLSTARATAVIVYFAEQLGIEPARLAAAGYGEHHPVASNSTVEGRSKNRRVDIVVAMMPTAEPVQATVYDGTAPPAAGAGRSGTTAGGGSAGAQAAGADAAGRGSRGTDNAKEAHGEGQSL
jgi:chemotaxis protein MotB